ncbi:MAG: hypothetical protein E7Z91_06495 [Cyanobacteria bacterium SIG30]|nr:hypothetical protein [Cyanobacteria bacterium SIG30]
MQNKKYAFTIAELMVGVSLLIIIIGLTIPVTKQILPNQDKHKVKHAYFQILSITQAMANDIYLYPTGDFSKMQQRTDANGITYGNCTGTCTTANDKFSTIFKSKLNILKENMHLENEIKNLYNNSGENAGNYEGECFLTNNGVVYCIPKKMQFTASGDQKANIGVFFERNGNYRTLKNGYFFTVDKFGKVEVKPTDDITGTATNQDCGFEDSKGNYPIYAEYNHCKTNDFLTNTTN